MSKNSFVAGFVLTAVFWGLGMHLRKPTPEKIRPHLVKAHMMSREFPEIAGLHVVH